MVVGLETQKTESNGQKFAESAEEPTRKNSSKTKKLLRISPKLKKKSSRKEEGTTMKDMASAQGKSKKLNDKIPNGLNDKERLELKQTFDLFDKNHDGKISSEELGCVLRTLGHDYTVLEVEEMIKNADTNENGFVEYDEFLQLMKRWSKSQPTGGAAAEPEPESTDEERRRETFKVFDMDGNGYIDEHELRYVMRRLGENLGEEDVRAMFHLADLNGDGLIDYDEFNKLMGGLCFPVVPKEGTKSSPPKSSKKDASKK